MHIRALRRWLTRVGMVVIGTAETPHAGQSVEKREAQARWEARWAQPPPDTVWALFRKLATEPARDPVILLLGFTPRKRTH